MTLAGGDPVRSGDAHLVAVGVVSVTGGARRLRYQRQLVARGVTVGHRATAQVAHAAEQSPLAGGIVTVTDLNHPVPRLAGETVGRVIGACPGARAIRPAHQIIVGIVTEGFEAVIGVGDLHQAHPVVPTVGGGASHRIGASRLQPQQVVSVLGHLAQRRGDAGEVAVAVIPILRGASVRVGLAGDQSVTVHGVTDGADDRTVAVLVLCLNKVPARSIIGVHRLMP